MLKCVVLIAAILLFAHATAEAQFRAGAAVREVNPDPLLPLSGGAGPSKPAETRVGDITVRALVLEQGDTRVAIVGADFLGFPSPLCDRVRALAPGIPAENILIGVTHNHSGPDCYGFPDSQGGHSADLDYLDMVCKRMAEAINEAVDTLRPATLKIATDAARGKIAYNYYAERLYDPRCHVIQAIGTDGAPIATLVNYASHPEILGPGQGIMSPDFCGPLYDRIPERGGGIGIYMNSAQGGMVTADCRGPDGKDIQTWEECVRIGNLMADEALRIVSDAPVQADPVLYCAARPLTFPVDSDEIRMLAQVSPIGSYMNDDFTVTTQLNLVNVGNAQILTIPGEALPNIGFYMKRNMHGEHNFLFGLTNDAYGYIMAKVDWRSFERYNYVSTLNLGEMTGEIYMTEALKFADESPRPQRLSE